MKKLILLVILFTINLSAQKNIEHLFEGIDGCFIMYDFNNDEYFSYNEIRCNTRMLPASTFKISNSMIFLEEGIIPDENYVIKWDSVDRGWDKWNMDHDLKSALKYSAVWYYQELARKIDREIYMNYVDELNYGNKIIGDKIDYFWLDWSLRISADEQIEFLKKFVKNDLPFSQRNIDIVKRIMIAEETGNYILRGKTGLGDLRDGVYTGWYVGYVETKDNIFVFALNMDASDYEKITSQARINLTRTILKELNVLK